ncbi:hypothetical protein MYX65_09720 [Acidobacteria bacterium AH-259-L09]|nr:hypothetical protein [Acidobacteria bacterium AH-259-L09]
MGDNYIPNDPVGPEHNIEGFGNFGRDIFLPSFGIERLYEVRDNVSLVWGKHTVRFGGLYQAIDNTTNSQTFFGGRFNFGSVIPLSNIIALNPALGSEVLNQLNTFLRANGGAQGEDNNNNGLADSLDAPISALQAFNFNLPIVYQQGFGSTANSFYSAGTVQLIKRFANNYAINLNYTYAKAIDDVTDFNSDFSAQNPLNVRLDRSLSAFDQRHRFVLSSLFFSPVSGSSAGNFSISPGRPAARP